MAQQGNLAFDTNKLIAVVRNLKVAQSFLLDMFFPTIVTADTETVSIDVEIGKRRMSPFVSPLVQGKLVEQLRMQTNSFRPAYIKDKRAPDLRKPVKRMLGERIGGEQSMADRELMNLEMELADQVDMLTRRLEWMAAQVLSYGAVTIAGEGFPATLVDFGRDPSLTMALSGAGQWGVPGNFSVDGRDPVPTSTLDAIQRNILKHSGAMVTDIVFTTTPFARFINAQSVFGAVYFPKQGDGNNINPAQQITRGGILKGVWGQYRLWLYNDWYVDENNVERPMLPDGMVLFGGPDLQGVRAFGAIMDPAHNYQSLPFAPKTWIENDPAQRLIMMQSAPIVIPSRVNAFASAMVCPGVYN